jgi:hypothetical protein
MLAMLAVTLFTMSSAAQPASTASAPVPATPPPHVVLIVMENHEYPAVIGSPAAPYVNQLAGGSVLLTHHHAVSHPSLPNYLALTGGSTFGITSVCTTCSTHATNLVDQLARHGLTWKAYMEGMPHACYKGAFSGGYAKKHDPFMYYDDIRNSPRRCREVVPFSQLGPDLSGGRLPRFAWITPNLCHDMHDCSVRTGDRWLAQWVPKILPALGSDGLLILTWDEGATDSACCSVARGGHVATIVAGPGARRGVKASSRTDHYSILRLVQDLFHLAHLRKAGQAPQISAYRR